MKKGLRLFLGLILAMTMVMGIGMTAFAQSLTLYLEDLAPGTVIDGTGYNDFDNPLYIKRKNECGFYCGKIGNKLYYTTDGDPVGGHTDSWDKPVGKNGGTYIVAVNDFYIYPIIPHVHDFQYKTIKEATLYSDGLEGEICSCGETRNTHTVSKLGYALNDYAQDLIKEAEPGQTVTFEFGELNSFPKSFMEKLAEMNEQNVTFVFHYEWNHEKQEITIPAGTLIDLEFEWYGPAKMAELYGAYTVNQNM